MDDYSPLRDDRRGAVRYVQAIRQHWVLIAILVVGSLTTSYVFVTTSAKRYEASVDLAVSPVPATDDTFQGLSVFRQSLDGSSSVVTAARVLNSPEVRIPAERAMGRTLSRAASISISPISQADVLAITATAPTAGQAAAAANSFAAAAIRVRTGAFQQGLRQQIARAERQLAAVPVSQRSANFEYSAIAQRVGVLKSYVGANDPTLSVIAQATPPASASWPRTKLILGSALVASLLLGCGVAVLFEVANPRVSREDELQLTHRLPVLARIPRLRARAVHGYLLGRTQLPGAAWKGYRTLRAVLATAGPDGGFPHTILVTSATPGDGKTMTAVNLAITLAASDMRVMLVDADLHRPMVSTIFHTPARGDGLTGVLSGRTPLEAAIVPAPAHGRLNLLLARPEHYAHVRLFDASRVQSLLHRLRDRADVVVIDSPPLPEVAEALELAAAVDAVLVAVRLGHTERERLDQLREMLARRGIAPIGFVVTTRRAAEGETAYDYAGAVEEGGRSRPTAEGQATIVHLQDR